MPNKRFLYHSGQLLLSSGSSGPSGRGPKTIATYVVPRGDCPRVTSVPTDRASGGERGDRRGNWGCAGALWAGARSVIASRTQLPRITNLSQKHGAVRPPKSPRCPATRTRPHSGCTAVRAEEEWVGCFSGWAAALRVLATKSRKRGPALPHTQRPSGSPVSVCIRSSRSEVTGEVWASYVPQLCGLVGFCFFFFFW
jgi:hypothetical protein